MSNCSAVTVTNNITNFDCKSEGFPLAFWIVFVLLETILLALNIAVVAVLVRTTAITSPLRIILTNLQFSNLLSILVAIGYGLSAIILSQLELDSTHTEACRVVVWLWMAVVSARWLLLAEWAVAVFLILRFGLQVLSKKTVITVEVIIWIFALATTAYLLVPGIANAEYSHCLCTMDTPNNGTPRIYLTSIWLTLTMALPIAIAIVSPIATWFYVRKKAEEVKGHAKSMLKFIFFLLLGYTTTIIGGIIPVVRPGGALWIYLSYIAISMSNFPLPILMLIFFKPLRKKIAAWTSRSKRYSSIMIRRGKDSVDNQRRPPYIAVNDSL